MGAYEHNAKVVQQRLTGALEKFKSFMTPPLSSYAVRTVNEVLKVAALEYEAAIEDGKFVNPMEYQDARGFVWTAEAMYADVAKDLEKLDAGKLAEIRSLIAELKEAFPTTMPPDAPRMNSDTLAARVSRIEELSAAYW